MIFRAPEVASFLGSFLGGTTPRGSAAVTSSSVSVPWLSTCYKTFGNDVAFVFAKLRVSISRLSGSDFLGLHVSSAHKCSVAMQTDISRAPCSNHHEGPSSWLDGHIASETNFYTCPSPSSAQDCVTCPSKRKEALALTDLASGLAKRTRPPRRQVSYLSVFSGRSCSRYRLCQSTAEPPDTPSKDSSRRGARPFSSAAGTVVEVGLLGANLPDSCLHSKDGNVEQ